jgi:hypothetical protein
MTVSVEDRPGVARRVPATMIQRALWILDRYRGGQGIMGVPLLYRIRGPLDEDALQASLHQVMTRHEALRTVFASQQGALQQVVLASPPPVPVTRFAVPDAADPAAAAYDLARQQLRTDPDISVSPVRASLWSWAADDHLLVVDIHHFVTDAWSNMLVSRDLAHFYSVQAHAERPPLPEVTWQYPDYALWLNGHLQGPALREHREFWGQQLKGAHFGRLTQGPGNDDGLPPDRSRPRSLAANTWIPLDADLVEQLRACAIRLRTTLFVVLLSLFMDCIARETGHGDVAIGSIFANRQRPECRETVGCFANMVTVRANLSAGNSIEAGIAQVRRSVLAAIEHEEMSHLALRLSPDHMTGRPDEVVFHMLAVPPTAGSGRTDFGDLDVTPLPIPDGLSSRFNLELLMIPGVGKTIDGVFRYAEDRFDADFVSRLADSYLAAARELPRRLAA